jgi:hypothetical protein
MSDAYIFALIFSVGVFLGFIIPRRKRPRVRKAKVPTGDPPNRKTSGPYSVSASGRKPKVNDDFAGWKREMDLRRE